MYSYFQVYKYICQLHGTTHLNDKPSGKVVMFRMEVIAYQDNLSLLSTHKIHNKGSANAHIFHAFVVCTNKLKKLKHTLCGQIYIFKTFMILY